MAEALLFNAALLAGVMVVLWLFSLAIGDVSFIDAVWGGAMALLALTSWLHTPAPGALATLILVMTLAWGIRLAVYLLRRWRREGQDARYERILRRDRERGRYALAALIKVFGLQAVLLFLVCLPAQLGILASAKPAPVGPLGWAGLALFLVGIAFEWIGDFQLSRFRADPANAGRVLDTGLWRYTRHPNYFGDACAWWGIWLAAASAGPMIAVASVAGPLFLTFTLARWSGAPLLEKGLRQRREGYEEYIARTSGFIPLPPRSS